VTTHRTQQTDAAVQSIQAAISSLSLSDSDFLDDRFVARLSDMSTDVENLGVAFDGSEAWLIDWLSSEHYKGASLYVSAKTNWAKENSNLNSVPPFDPLSRAAKMTRFNTWAQDLAVHIGEYERSARTPEVVSPWFRRALAFRDSPTDIRN
jgi:hypothetical protein